MATRSLFMAGNLSASSVWTISHKHACTRVKVVALGVEAAVEVTVSWLLILLSAV